MKNLFPIVFALCLAGCSQPKETIEYWRDDEGNSYPVTVTQEGEDTIYNFGNMVMTSDVMTLQKDKKKEDKKSFKIIAPMGHTGIIEDYAFSSDGKYAATVGMDKKVVMWDLIRDREIFSSQGHTDQIASVDFSPDNSKIVTSGWDKTIRVWDAANGELFQTLWGHVDIVGEVFFFNNDNNRIVSVVRDRGYHEVFVWDLKTGSRILEFSGDAAVLSSNDSFLFISNSDEDVITCYSTITGGKLKEYIGTPSIDIEFPPSKSQIYTLEIDASQSRVISSGGSGATMVWDIESTNQIHRIDGHKSRVFVSEFSPNGKYILTAGDVDGLVKIWDSNSGEMLFQHQDISIRSIRSAVFSSDGKYAAYISSGSVRIIDLDKFEIVVDTMVNATYFSKISCTDDPKIFALTNSDQLSFFEFENGNKVKALRGRVEPTGLQALGFRQNENSMEEDVVGDNYIFDINHPESIQFFQEHFIHVSSDGKVGWVIRNNNELLEVEIPSLSVKKELRMEGLTNNVSDGALENLQCSDKYIFLEYNDSIFVHSRLNYKLKSKFSGRNLALSNDSELIGYTTDYIADQYYADWLRNSLLVHNLNSGDTVFYQKTRNCFTELIFSSDVKYVCGLTMSGYYDSEAFIFDVENKISVDTIKEDTGYADFLKTPNLIIHPKNNFWDERNNASLKVRDITTKQNVSELSGSSIKYESKGKLFSTISNKVINMYSCDSLVSTGELYSDSPVGDVLLFNSETNKLVSTGTNRKLVAWDTKEKSEIYSMIILEKNNWLIQIPNSPYYMSSPDALSYLCFSDYKGVHCADEKFDKKYNKPRIVLKEIKKYFPEN
jgi:WD40 repeat protein